jgi:hypothetical protein
MMSLHLSLSVQVDAGTRIEDAFCESVELAGRVGVCVNFKFNNVDCTAFPNGDVSKGVEEYFAAINSDKKYKFAFAR